MNNPRKYTSQGYTEVKVWRYELPITFLLGLPKDKLSRTPVFGERNILFGNSADSDSDFEYLGSFMMLDKQV